MKYFPIQLSTDRLLQWQQLQYVVKLEILIFADDFAS